MTHDPNPRPKVALVWRGDRAARETASAETSRLRAIFRALEAQGFDPQPAVYGEDVAGDLRAQLLGVDAALVWVDPISNGARRLGLDAILREVAEAGVYVSGHPDVTGRMGVKAVLHTTRSLGWGVASEFYETAAAFAAGFPARLAEGVRVLKPNRGNGGIGVVRVEALPGGQVHVRDARADAGERVLSLSAFMAERLDDFAVAGGLVDQPFQARLTEGMVRCYMTGERVTGFGHQMVRALAAPEEGAAGPRLYSGPDDARFQDLRTRMERDWTPGLCRLLDIAPDDLPVIWDADFLLGPKTPDGADSYVLCEINANSVFPVPDEAPAALAATLAARLEARERKRSPR